MRSRIRNLSVGVLLLVVCCATSIAKATVTVTLDIPSEAVVGEMFEVQIVADLTNPVLGWGLDFESDAPSVAAITNVEVGADWLPVATSDGDGLAGAAFPSPIQGSQILLATLTLEALTEGEIQLSVSDDHPVDLTEGFALDPNGFDTVNYEPMTLTVVPEPVTSAVLGIAGIATVARRRNAYRAKPS